jgi:hypothetical protein
LKLIARGYSPLLRMAYASGLTSMLLVVVSPYVTTRSTADLPLAVVTAMHASQYPATFGMPFQRPASKVPSACRTDAAYFVLGAQALCHWVSS